MINLLAEGRTYHEMLDFAERFEQMQYRFYKHDNLHGLLAAYRYPQAKLFSSEHKFSLYPTQLVILARYYFYHHEKENLPAKKLENLGEEDPIRSEEEVRSLLCRWLVTLREKLQKNKGEYAVWETFDQFCAPLFQMPLHSNTLPLDVILQEARRAGRLDREDFTDYPDPAGLPVLRKNGDDEEQWEIVEYSFDGSADNRKIFWEAQLDALTECWYQEKKKEEERADKKRKYQKDYAQLTTIEIDRIACTREIQAVFMLSVWYAQQYRLHRKRMQSLGLAQEEAFCAPAEVDRIGRTHKAFYGSLDKKLLPYRSMFRKYPVTFGSETNTMLQVTYADPKAYVGRPALADQRITLPAWEDLDNGYRNWDYDDYYGISVKLLMEVLPMIKFEDGQPRYRIEGDVPDRAEIRETLENFYMGVGKMLYTIWEREERADAVLRTKMAEADQITEPGADLMQKAMRIGSLTMQERVYLQNYLKTYFHIEITADIMAQKHINVPAAKHIARITDAGTTGAKLRDSITYLSRYMVTHDWFTELDKEHYDMVTEHISSRVREAFVVSPKRYEALAGIIARTYTWAVLLCEDWKNAGSGTEYILWNRPKHLRIPEVQVILERAFRTDLIVNVTAKRLDKLYGI